MKKRIYRIYWAVIVFLVTNPVTLWAQSSGGGDISDFSDKIGTICKMQIYLSVPIGLIAMVVGGVKIYKGSEDGGLKELIGGGVIALAGLITRVLFTTFASSFSMPTISTILGW